MGVENTLLSRRRLIETVLSAPAVLTAALSATPTLVRANSLGDGENLRGNGESPIPIEGGLFYPTSADGAGYLVKKTMAQAFQERGGDLDWGKPVSSEFVDDQGMPTQVFERATFQLSANGRDCVVTDIADTQVDIPLQNTSPFNLVDGRALPLAPTVIISPNSEIEAAILSKVTFEIGDDVSEADRAQIRDGTFGAIRAFRMFANYTPVGLVVLAYQDAAKMNAAQAARLKRQFSVAQRIAYWQEQGEGESEYRSIFEFTGGKVWKSHNPLRHESSVAHEGYHTLQREFVGRSVGSVSPDIFGPAGPVWFVEGSAECFGYRAATLDKPIELKSSLDGAIAYARRYSTPLPSMETSRGFGNATPDVGGGYGLARIAVEFLVDSTPGGWRALTHYFNLVGHDIPFDRAFQMAFGRDIDTFYKEYDQYTKAGYKLTVK